MVQCAPAIQVRSGRANATTEQIPEIAEIFRRTLDGSDEQLDYARAKIAFDRLVDPSLDDQWVLAKLDGLTSAAVELAGAGVVDTAKLSAVRTVIYESGPWNDERPFAYDPSDPLGRSMPNKLLHNYLATRRGQCVSMPTLFLILADRLGLNVGLALAPDHVFVRYTDAQGRSFNLETTSGGHPSRDEWVRQHFPMSDLAVRNGLYLRSLSRREAVAVLASTVVEHLFRSERFEEAITVCEVLLRHHPRDVNIMLSLGSACGKLLDALRLQYPIPWTAPPVVRARMQACMERNRSLFAEAERLGWMPEE